MLEVINNPFVYVVIFIIGLIGMRFTKRKLDGLRNAEYVIKNQNQKVPKHILDEGFDEFKGEKLERYKALLFRTRTQYGHDNVKVGHVAWMMQVLDDEFIDVNTINIPAFAEK